MKRKPNGSGSGTFRAERSHIDVTTDREKARDNDAHSGIQEEVKALQEKAFHLAMDIILSQPQVVNDDEISPLIQASRDRNYAAIDRWLSGRMAEIKKHWKHILKVPHHRVMSIDALRLYLKAAELRKQKKLSWTQLAREVDPEGLQKDARGTIERLRKGIASVEKKRWHFGDMAFIPAVFPPRKMGDIALKPSIAPGRQWARKKLKEFELNHFYLVERAEWTPRQILRNASSEYLHWANHVARLSNSNSRKVQMRKLLTKERLGMYLCLFWLAEGSLKPYDEWIHQFSEDFLKLHQGLRLSTEDLITAHHPTPPNQAA